VQICSFLPSATEILYAVGAGNSVAGVTFECDYPPEAREKPVVVGTVLEEHLSPGEIDDRVTEFASHGESLYTANLDLLRRIKPDLIVTQELCDVCAVSTSHLVKALHALTPKPEVLSLTPHGLADVFGDITSVGSATGNTGQAVRLLENLHSRLARMQEKRKMTTPKVACLEWLNPLFNAGHWVPEMVEIAGGIDVSGKRGEYSVRIECQEIITDDPDVIVIMPRGYTAQKAAEEYRQTLLPEGWNDLRAVRERKVFAVHASAYFSRPGPRLVDGVEILHTLLHEDFSMQLPPDSWIRI